MTGLHERARRALALLRAMAAAGYLGTDPETAFALADLAEFVERQTPTPEVQRGEGTKDQQAEGAELPEDPARD